jgi:xanthine dehydrogenase accessory factor
MQCRPFAKEEKFCDACSMNIPTNSSMNWLSTLLRLQQQNVPAIMVTVVSISGSTPREVGAKIIVTATQLFGTVGGGNLEHQATTIARKQLQSGQSQSMRRFPLGAGLGQCCGGLVNLLFEPIVDSTHWIAQAQALQLKGQHWVRAVEINGEQECFLVVDEAFENSSPALDGCYYETVRKPDFELLLFGAGHVGKAMVKVLSEMPVRIQWIDNREEQFPADIPHNVEVICTDTPEAEIEAANAGCFFLVMTHDHALDQHLAEQILKRHDFAYFGLIGSKTKRRMFEKRMARRGISPDRFDDMVCPIGIDGIRSKQPAAIAISVAAQLMRVHDLLSSIELSNQPSIKTATQQPTLLGSAI